MARWYLGEVEEVFCKAVHSGSLDIDVEDVAILICQHINGVLSEVHLDYVQRTYERGCQIVGERGSIFWDFKKQAVRWFDADQNKWNTFSQSKKWQDVVGLLDSEESVDAIAAAAAATRATGSANRGRAINLLTISQTHDRFDSYAVANRSKVLV